MNLTVDALWRYPVKTLAGEPLTVATVTTSGTTGTTGDRIVHVRGPEGVRTSRRHHHLLGLHATLGPDGEPLVDGLPWTAPELHIGDVVIGIDLRRGRCPMTTVDPDTLERDRHVLTDIIQRFDGKLALACHEPAQQPRPHPGGGCCRRHHRGHHPDTTRGWVGSAGLAR